MAHKGGKTAKGRTRKAQRRESAVRLAAERAKRSPDEQLALLDQRFGRGLGAKKERARLLAAVVQR